jgi:hypothetical protein
MLDEYRQAIQPYHVQREGSRGYKGAMGGASTGN